MYLRGETGENPSGNVIVSLYLSSLREAGTGIETGCKGFSQLRLPDLNRWLSIVFFPSLVPIVTNFPKLFEYHRMSGRELRIVPYNGNRAYKYYLDGRKVNGKRRRLFFKDVAVANRNLADACQAAEKRGPGRPRYFSRVRPSSDQFEPVPSIRNPLLRSGERSRVRPRRFTGAGCGRLRRRRRPVGLVRVSELVGSVTIMVADPFHREGQMVLVAAFGHQVEDHVRTEER